MIHLFGVPHSEILDLSLLSSPLFCYTWRDMVQWHLLSIDQLSRCLPASVIGYQSTAGPLCPANVVDTVPPTIPETVNDSPTNKMTNTEACKEKASKQPKQPQVLLMYSIAAPLLTSSRVPAKRWNYFFPFSAIYRPPTLPLTMIPT